MVDAAYHREYYRKNRKKISDRKRARSKKHYEYLLAFSGRVKTRYGCIDCGYKENPRALQFDHVREKECSVSDMIRRYVSISKLKDEMRKCEIRCANCHAVKTFRDRT